jgi:hypothetical protein
MTRNTDGSITLSVEDIEAVNALITAAQSALADKDTFTSEAATRFVREWSSEIRVAAGHDRRSR